MRKLNGLAAAFILAASPALSQDSLSSADRTAAFRAGGFKLQNGQWRGCGDPGISIYEPGHIETVRDLNGDGRPEAVIVEGSLYCFGNTGTGYTIVSKQADGTWKLITQNAGMANFHSTKGVGGWPDIEVHGPGFCFAVMRWNGKDYMVNRYQYEGKICQP